MKTSLTAALITKNEQADLPRCLESLRDVVDEIVVVDTGSTDRTVAIAEEFGARVGSFPWCDDFSAARNEALSLVNTPWVLVIDADEELDRSSRGTLGSVLEGASVDAFRLTVRNFTPPTDLVRWRDVPVTRLFRADRGFCYEGRIHEQIGAAVHASGSRIGDADIVLLHHGYARSSAQGSSRVIRNLKLLEAMSVASPDDAYVLYQLGQTQVAADRPSEAEITLQLALRLDRGDLGADGQARCLVSLSQLALARGDDRAALDRATQALRLAPRDLVALYVSGVAALTLGDVHTAISALERAVHGEELGARHRADVERLLALCRSGLASV